MRDSVIMIARCTRLITGRPLTRLITTPSQICSAGAAAYAVLTKERKEETIRTIWLDVG